jgi:DMSO/TMAO reductase YedYZ molybdopterin-dependent catalytic subunit
MAGRRTNLALVAFLAAALLTGALAFGAGTEKGAWLAILHGVVGLAIVLLTPWKSVIVRRGLSRRRPGTPISLFLTFVVMACVAAGFAHAMGIARFLGPVTAMQVHVGAGLLAVPLASVHIRARPTRLRRSDASRRQLLKLGGLAAGSGVAYLAVEGMTRALGLPGRSRRFTGSYERGSLFPDDMPVTQWLDDSVPLIDVEEWVLRVHDGVTESAWTYADLSAFHARARATLDCTGGWWAIQEWEGVPLRRLLDQSLGRSLVVTSSTGYSRRLPLTDVDNLLLALRVGGRPLSAGHGAPARLVAPGRRGFWWVKWVTRIDVDGAPWWLQSPFPLT